MTIDRFFGFSWVHLAMLRSAALLVPLAERREWLAEWTSELWYMLQACHHETPLAIHVNPSVTRFCLGAFRDALWLRRNSPSPHIHRIPWLQSPLRCVLCLVVLAAATLFFAFRLPGPRDSILPSPYRDARNLVMISPDGHFAESVPTVSIEQYQLLSNPVQHPFAGLAFYQPILTRVRTARNQTVEMSVVLASGKLFDLLHIPVSVGLAGPGNGGQTAAKLILSEAAWCKYFDRDPQVVGRVLEVAGQKASVAGIISGHSWRLPGRADAWLLEDNASLVALPSHAKGFVLGRSKTPAPHLQWDWRWHLSVPNEHGGYDGFECASLVHRQPILASFLMIAIAFLILPVTTSLALGEYPATAHSPARATRFLRWVFLGIKFTLLLPIVFCGTLDLAPIISSSGIQPHATLVGYVLAFRWALIDQRKRCPVCLRLLTNPVRIGQPSQIFLGWYGTELLCAKGHGLLHVPEMPTSSYNTQRWLYLDPSWSSLFS